MTVERWATKNGSCRSASSSLAASTVHQIAWSPVEARGQRRAMAERALVALEGGERDAALVRLVAVMDQEARHATRLTAGRRPDIGRAPRSRTLTS